MRSSVFRGLLAAAGLAAGTASAATLDDVLARGTVRCGISAGPSDVIAADAGGWIGFDASVCRALGAAVLGDPAAVEFVPGLGDDAVRMLADQRVDVLIRDGAWTLGRDTDMPVDFTTVIYYDGQGFLVPKALGITSAKELTDQQVCAVSTNRSARNLEDFTTSASLALTVLPEPDAAAAVAAYLAGECEVMTAQRSDLAALRSAFETPTDHVILPDMISKEPLAPVVREGDDGWADIVRWTVFALVAAEELGITSANIEEMAKAPTSNPEINRLLGTDGDLGAMLGLPADWAKMAIKAGGNYGEIFARTLGEGTPISLPRGLSALWRDGGLLYAPPFR